MIGRRASVGLSLLCALAFCAFAAQGASAKGTTAFTCHDFGPGATNGNFTDAHCDNELASQRYGHVVFTGSTLVDITNEKTSHETQVTTPALLRGTAGGLTFELQCTHFTGKATIENKEIEKVMQVEATKGSGSFTSCTVIRPENSAEERHPCKVVGGEVKLNEPQTSITRENLGAGKEEMGVEFKPPAGKSFATFEFEGVNCALKGTKIEVTTTTGAIATGNIGSNKATTSNGATLKFTTAMTAETLKIGGEKGPVAEFSAVFTVSKYNEITQETESPISLTTTAT